MQFHIICSFYYSIGINPTEVDPHSNSLHNGKGETQEYCEHDEDQESFQSSIHQFYLKIKNISILNIILEYNIWQVDR